MIEMSLTIVSITLVLRARCADVSVDLYQFVNSKSAFEFEACQYNIDGFFGYGLMDEL